MAEHAEREPRIGDLIVVHQADGTTVPAVVMEVECATSVRLAYLVLGHFHLCPHVHERGEHEDQWSPWE